MLTQWHVYLHQHDQVLHLVNAVDPRVVEYFDIDATVDASFPVDCLNPESSSLSGEIFQRRSSKSRPCSDDSMSQSS
jgi:hypothetical protein